MPNHNLEGVLRKSLNLNEEEITDGIIDRIESEFKSKKLEESSVVPLLIISIKSKGSHRAFEVLYQHRNTLIQASNVCSVLDALLTMTKRGDRFSIQNGKIHDIQSLW